MYANDDSKVMPFTLRKGTKIVGGRGLRRLELFQAKNICQAKSNMDLSTDGQFYLHCFSYGASAPFFADRFSWSLPPCTSH